MPYDYERTAAKVVTGKYENITEEGLGRPLESNAVVFLEIDGDPVSFNLPKGQVAMPRIEKTVEHFIGKPVKLKPARSSKPTEVALKVVWTKGGKEIEAPVVVKVEKRK